MLKRHGGFAVDPEDGLLVEELFILVFDALYVGVVKRSSDTMTRPFKAPAAPPASWIRPNTRFIAPDYSTNRPAL